MSVNLFKRTVYIALFICLIASIIIVSAVFIVLDNSKLSEYNQILDYNDSWESQASIVNFPQTVNGNGAMYSFTKMLPNQLYRNTVLYLNTNYKIINAYIDGKELKTNGITRGGIFGISYVDSCLIYEIPPDSGGKQITLSIASSDKVHIATIMLGDKDSLLISLFSNCWLTVLASIIMIILAVAMLLFGRFCKRAYNDFDYGSTVYLSLFMICSTIWILTDCQLVRAYYINNDAFYLLSYFALTLIPIPILLYISEQCNHGKKILYTSASFTVFVFAHNLLLTLFGGISLNDTLYVVYSVHAISVLIIFIVTIIDYLFYKNKKISVTAFAVAIFTLVNVISFLRINNKVEYIDVFRASILIFSLILTTGLLYKSMHLLSHTKRFEYLAANIPCGICRTDINDLLSISYANKHFSNLFGSVFDSATAESPVSIENVISMKSIKALVSAMREAIKDKSNSKQAEIKNTLPNGETVWVLANCSYTPKSNEIITVVIDITARKKTEERLKISEEEYRIASQHSEKYIARFDIESKTLIQQNNIKPIFNGNRIIRNVPDSIIKSGIVSSAYADSIVTFFSSIMCGNPTGSTTVMMKDESNEYKWFRFDYTTVYSEDNKPYQAVISFYDATQQYEKELAYEKWLQTYMSLPYESMNYYEFNLTSDICVSEKGGMLQQLPPNIERTLSSMIGFYVQHYVYPDDKNIFSEFCSHKRLNDYYNKSICSDKMEFRRIGGNGEPEWTLATAQLIADPFSNDIKAFILLQDIHEQKLSELLLNTRSTQDPLTGLLNRTAFVEKVNELFSVSDKELSHILIIIDVDKFKRINDTFGHRFGDNVLIEIADVLRRILRSDDFIARLGGDEFVICLTNIPVITDAAQRRAEAICNALIKSFGNDIAVSASLGMAVYPNDGTTFDELYVKADKAMYTAKQSGNKGYAFYSKDTDMPRNTETAYSHLHKASGKFDTLLIINGSDDEINTFKPEYNTITAEKENALESIKENANDIGAVILYANDNDEYLSELLKTVRNDTYLSAIPVIVIGESESHKASENAISLGAFDYITVDSDKVIIKMRINNAITRREIYEIQAENRFLLLQKNEQEEYRNVLESTRTFVAVLDWNTKRFKYDKMSVSLLSGNYDNRDLWTILREDMISTPEAADELRSLVFQTAKSAESKNAYMNMLLKDTRGIMKWHKVNISKAFDINGGTAKLFITVNDVQDEILNTEKLRYLAEYDLLTGIYNRTAFVERTQKFISSNPSKTMMLVRFDIENFKVINDFFGHSEGDRLLKLIANHMKQIIGNKGIYARIDSDNFVFCIPYSTSNVETTLMTGSTLFQTNFLNFDIVLKFGFYVVTDKKLPVDIMLDRATIAQRTIKNSYIKKYAFYDETLRRTIIHEQWISSRMNKALEKNEFIIYLQPKCRVDTGEIIGAEALVRWKNEERGLLSPNEFIPIFEKNGFIMKLDAYVWEKVCIILRKWLDFGNGKLPLPISANISRVNIYNPNLTGIITDLVSKYDIPNNLFELEVTETAYADNSPLLFSIIKELRSKGFIMQMDDFGSGYSSLNMLKDIPVDVLKIDMGFLADTEDKTRGKEILKAVIEMAHKLDLPIVAEGVETKEQVELLKEIGCMQGQGYYFYKPMTISEFEMLFK